MSLPHSHPPCTVEEYLALERASEQRYEFLDGQIYLMAGESLDHGTICTNISGQFYNQLRGKPCQVFSKDMKVRSGPEPKSRYETKGLYSYPDLVLWKQNSLRNMLSCCSLPACQEKHRPSSYRMTISVL
jgi:Uma2 family endonuclease